MYRVLHQNLWRALELNREKQDTQKRTLICIFLRFLLAGMHASGWRGLLQMAIVHTVFSYAHPPACLQACTPGG